MLKYFKKPFIIIPVLIPVLVLSVKIISFLVAHILFGYTSTWIYCVEDFGTYRKDFEIVAEFCQEHIAQKGALEKERIIFVYNFKKKELLCDWKNIEVSDEIKKSLENIKIAFPCKDAQFDSITVDERNIYFKTHNGLYSVVYSKEGRPKLVDGVNKGKSRRIDDNWYHVVRQ